ncbi:MAG: hemerythrin domain-containing protein [Bryobacteraceae bacterium]|jgi:iron-sulfur cluster repair protein YtfE (RIC family)
MLRDPNLIPLSHQHHNALAMCVLTRRSLRADASPANTGQLARRAVDRYELELANHFEIEEQILFPAMENALGPIPLLLVLAAEHRQVEDLIAQLRAAPTEDLLERLCGLLSEHIRREESDLFQMAQARLPEAVLHELGAAIEARAVRICL